jgi:hypothetical protein
MKQRESLINKRLEKNHYAKVCESNKQQITLLIVYRQGVFMISFVDPTTLKTDLS